MFRETLKQIIVQFPSDTCALADALFQTKFNDAASCGPSKEGGDEKRGDCRYRHDRENPPLHASHFQDGLCDFAVGLLLNAANQYWSLSLDWFQFVVQPSLRSYPVPWSRQAIDGVELRRQGDFDRFQGRQEGRIYLDSARLAGGRPRLSNLFLENSAQWLGRSGQVVCIARPYKVIEPLVKRKKAYLKL
jgi:hypothetical protein